MSALTLYLAKLIGSVMTTLSIYMLIRRERLIGLVRNLMADPDKIFWIGVMRLVAGLALVIGHDVWSGGALPVVISLLGWVIFFSGLLTLFAPHERLIAVFQSMKFEENYAIYASGTFLFGIFLLIGGFAGALNF